MTPATTASPPRKTLVVQRGADAGFTPRSLRKFVRMLYPGYNPFRHGAQIEHLSEPDEEQRSGDLSISIHAMKEPACRQIRGRVSSDLRRQDGSSASRRCP